MSVTVQLVLWTLALAAAIAGLAQVYRLHKRPRAPRPWWETTEGVAALSPALRPLWFAAALTVPGALAPRLFRLVGA